MPQRTPQLARTPPPDPVEQCSRSAAAAYVPAALPHRQSLRSRLAMGRSERHRGRQHGRLRPQSDRRQLAR